MHLHRASQHSLHENSKRTPLAAGQRRLTAVRHHWGCQSRALHIRCGHVRGSSNSSSAAASVSTAVAAFNAHQLTCEYGSSSSSVQDLLLVVRDEHRARQQRQQEQERQQQELQHVAVEQPQHQQVQQAPQHLALLEALQTQPSYAQPARSRALQQQQRAQPRQQQQQQRVPPLQEHAQYAHLQQQQQLELHMLEQQPLHHWDMSEQQQQVQHHHVSPQPQQLLQQVEVLDRPIVGVPADAAQQRQRSQQQQRQLDQAAATSSSSRRIAVPSTNGNGRQSTACASPALPVMQQGVADVGPRSRAKPRQRQRRQQQQRQPVVLGLRNTHGWTRAEVLQGWQFNATDNIARTPLGHAMVRTNNGSQPHSLAAQLLRWLQCEQCAVLSAAGAGRTLTALQAVSELQQQLEQQQVQLLVTPQTRSSRRPEGGRCTVYTLHCQMVPAGDAAAAAAPEQPAVQMQAVSAPSVILQAQDEHVQQQQQQQAGQQSGQWQRQQHEEYGGSQHWQGQQQQHLSSAQQNGRQRHHPDLQQQQHWQHEHARTEHHQQQQQHCGHMPVSGMLQLADAIEQQQLQQQRRRVNGTSSQAQQLHWQQHGLELRLPPQQLNGCSSSRQQQNAALRQQQHHHQHDNWPSHADATRSQPAAAAAVAPGGVLELDVCGSPEALSEQLELALQRHAAVLMPVVYDKQASKLLEAAASLNRRWQQQRQLHHTSGSSSSSNEALSDASSAAPGLQLVLQLQEAWVQRQSGPRPGLYVYVFAVPSVH